MSKAVIAVTLAGAPGAPSCPEEGRWETSTRNKLAAFKTGVSLTRALLFLACITQFAFASALPGKQKWKSASFRPRRLAQSPSRTPDYGTTEPMMLEGAMGTEAVDSFPTASPVPDMEEEVSEEDAPTTNQSNTASRRRTRHAARHQLNKELVKKYSLFLTAALLSAAAARLGTAWYKKDRESPLTPVPAGPEDLVAETASIIESPTSEGPSRAVSLLMKGALLTTALSVAIGLYFLYTMPESQNALRSLFFTAPAPEVAETPMRALPAPEVAETPMRALPAERTENAEQAADIIEQTKPALDAKISEKPKSEPTQTKPSLPEDSQALEKEYKKIRRWFKK